MTTEPHLNPMEGPTSVEIARRSLNWPALVALLRPYQWPKNAIVLAALIFSKRLLDPASLLRALVALLAFCAISSTGYVLNDLADIEADRVHPEKRSRPLPSGKLTRSEALLAAFVLGSFGFTLSVMLGPGFIAIAALYLGLQYAYSSCLKRIVVLDVIAIAIGFVLRAYAGGAAISVPVSQWLAFTTFLLALFLALARRHHELKLLGADAGIHRNALFDYDLGLVDQLISITVAATLVAYTIYTVTPGIEGRLGTQNLYLTVPIVTFGLFRYLYLLQRRDEGGDPSRLLVTDRPLLFAVLLWVAADIALLYF